MESFYSIIYYKTNALTDERLSIGILSGGGEGPFIHISNARMNLLKKVVHPNTFLSVKRHLKALSEKVEKHRNESAGILLFDPIFSIEQMEILSKQTKNAILYSEPTTINEWLDIRFFKDLITSFLGENTKSEPSKRPVFHLKWRAFYQSNKLAAYKRDVPISSLQSSATLSLTIDLVNTENKEIIKGIDFDLGETSLKRKLYELELIVNALPNYKIKVVHPTPKKKLGKEAFKSSTEKFDLVDFQRFSTFKKNI